MMYVFRRNFIGCLFVLLSVFCNSAFGQRTRSGFNSDANDGPSYPPPSNNNQGNRPNGNNNDAAAGLIFGAAIADALIKSAQAAEKQQRPQQQSTWPQYQQPQQRYPQPQYIQPQPSQRYPQPQYSQPQQIQPRPAQPQTTYVPTPVVPQAVVKPNPKPIEKVIDPKTNLKPTLSGFSLASDAELDLLTKVVEKEVKEDFEEIVDGLGDVAKDSEVAKILEEGQQAVIDGEELDETWKDRLKLAVGDAIKKDPSLTTALTPKEFDKLVADFEKTNEAFAALLKVDNPIDNGIGGPGDIEPGNGGGLLPHGNIPVVFVPALGVDDVLVIPDGRAIVMGTGGVGSLDTIQVDAAEALGIPLGIGQPEPDTSLDVKKTVKDGVVLSNPKENEVEINYLVSNSNFSMKPGYSQLLGAGKTWEIRFSPGDGLPEAKQVLKDGVYYFGSKNNSWELTRQTFSVTVDNASNDQPFNYVADNTEVTIPPGNKKEHTSDYPIVLRFDRGDGGKESLKKISKKNYNLKIGINPADGLWDLYPQEAASMVADSPRMDPKTGPAKEKASIRIARLRALLQATKN
jgi:hypothetical protein